MAAFDYAIPKATADRLLSRFGQVGTLRRPTSSGTAYDPTAGAPVDHAATFAVLDFSSRDIDGARILATDKMVLMAKGGLAIEPRTSDILIEADGSQYKIEAVNPFKPASVTVFYQLQVRR